MVYAVFLVGDGGDAVRGGQQPSLTLLDAMLEQAGERSAVVFLGDNIYPSGLPPTTSPERADAERRINAQLDVVKGHPGQVIFVPGNHDWGGLGLGGNRAALRRQEVYVESYLEEGNSFLPDRGFPGPEEVTLTDSLALIVIDTQWWLEDVKPYGNTGTYQLADEGEFLLELDDMLWRNSGKDVIIVAHHPMFSNGEHGGQFKGVRSLFTGERLARAYLGTPQDMSNFKYRQLREALLSIFEHHDDVVYAAGHDHNLQYFNHDGRHYIVSGSATKLGHVEEGRGASFVAEKEGFADIRYYTDGSMWLTFYEARDGGAAAEVLYMTRLREGNRPLVAVQDEEQVNELGARLDLPPSDTLLTDKDQGIESDNGSPAGDPAEHAEPELDDMQGSSSPIPTGAPIPYQVPYDFVPAGTLTVAANPDYNISATGEYLLGKHYRDVWTMPVSVPVIDLAKTAGGLTPVRKGGGLQTVSLRMEGADGDEYVLRSVDKDPTATIPVYLRRTIAHDVVQDQIAAIHPYGNLIIPRLARAAGIYHPHPTLAMIPDDPRLGIYRPIFAGRLASFESSPDEDQSDEARFGYAENVIGTPKLFENIQEDNDERVDERAFARARLFDMMIGDWDRHKDQWRWAEFDVTPGKVYKPVPRDRDFAFFKFDGFLPGIIRLGAPLKFRRFTNFFDRYEDILGLNYNGANMDRRFTSSLTREDWLEITDSLRAALTDQVIDEAVRDFPEPVYAYHGARMAQQLRNRRDELRKATEEYYELLAKNVDVVGSDRHERFEVTRINKDSTLVVMYKTSREGEIEREYFRRVFLTRETEEVRLYGLDGQDQFVITGDVRNSIRIRAVGGGGDDTFVDESSVRGGSRHSIFHDTETGNQWSISEETEVIRSNDPTNNEYRMIRFELDERAPLFHVARNVDDGFLLGGGVKFIKAGFRKFPYAAEHRIVGTAATRRKSFNAFYRAHFVELSGPWDGHVEIDALADRSFRNFYGLGNATNLEDRDFYRARIGGVRVEPSLERDVFAFTTIRFGPRFRFMNIEKPIEPLFQNSRFTTEDFVDKYFVGAEFELDIDGTDTLAATQDGLRWLNSVSASIGIRQTESKHIRLASEIAYFYTFHSPIKMTLGVRSGAMTNIGDFEFFQANTLGGQSNLRGFRRTRFAGHTAVFHNLDLRIHLAETNVYLMRGVGGILLFFDTGRVWAKGDTSSFWDWHHGYGGGIWLAPFNKIAVTATVGASSENVLFDLSFGFQF